MFRFAHAAVSGRPHNMSALSRRVFSVRALATDCIVFSWVFFCTQDNSLTAAVSSIKYVMNMFLDNRTKPKEFQGNRPKVKNIFVSGPKFTALLLPNVEKIVVHNAVLCLLIAWSVPEIFAIKVYSCPKSSALFITHEPLYLAWWNFACTSTSTTCRTLLNFKVIGQK